MGNLILLLFNFLVAIGTAVFLTFFLGLLIVVIVPYFIDWYKEYR